MRTWIFPLVIFTLAALALAFLYFNPQPFGPPPLSPLTPQLATLPPSLSALPSSPPTSAPPSGITAITLSAQKISSASAHLLWTIDGQSQNSFVVLLSTASAPTFPPRPGDQALSSSDPAAHDLTLANLSGHVFLRVCEFLGNSCGIYSNQVELTF